MLCQRCATLKIRHRILFHFQCRINVITTLKQRWSDVEMLTGKVFLLTFICLSLSQSYWASYIDHLINQIPLNTLTMFSQKLGFQINRVFSPGRLKYKSALWRERIFSNENCRTNNQNLPSVTKGHLNFCFSCFLEQLISVPTTVTSKIATLRDHVLD